MYLSILVALLTLASCIMARVPLASPQEACQPSVVNEESLKNSQCYVLNKACVDQETVIVYDPAVIADASGKHLPEISTEKLQFWWRHHIPQELWKAAHSHVVGGSLPFNKLYIRLPSDEEEGLTAEDTKNFSNCTVPIVLFQHWSMNLVEFFSRSVVFMYVFQQMFKSIDGNVSIVVANPAKVPMTSFNTFFLQPFTKHGITSFSQFSSRVPRSTQSNATAEGQHVRCFNKLVVCKFEGGRYPQMFEAAHFIHDYYKPRLPSTESFWTPGDTILRILFETRTNPMVRQVLNLKDIVNMCNSGGLTLPPGSNYTKMECKTHVFGKDRLLDITAASAADIFVLVHGAGMTNGLFMKRYSSYLELRQYEFGTKTKWMSAFWLPMISPQNDHQVFFWGLNLEEQHLYKPSDLETVLKNTSHALEHNYSFQMRHAILPPKLLQEMLNKILAVQRNATAYKEEYKENRVLFTAANGTLVATKVFGD